MGRGPWWHLPNETCIRIVRCMGASFSWFFPFYTPIFITISLFHCRSSDRKKKIDSPNGMVRNGEPPTTTISTGSHRIARAWARLYVSLLWSLILKKKEFISMNLGVSRLKSVKLKFHWQSNCILLEYPINSIDKTKIISMNIERDMLNDSKL